jgi:hypothetical protein
MTSSAAPDKVGADFAVVIAVHGYSADYGRARFSDPRAAALVRFVQAGMNSASRARLDENMPEPLHGRFFE